MSQYFYLSSKILLEGHKFVYVVLTGLQFLVWLLKSNIICSIITHMEL